MTRTQIFSNDAVLAMVSILLVLQVVYIVTALNDGVFLLLRFPDPCESPFSQTCMDIHCPSGDTPAAKLVRSHSETCIDLNELFESRPTATWLRRGAEEAW